MLKFILFMGLFVSQSYGMDFSKTICGEDDRLPSFNPKVARALKAMSDPAGCTMTLIGKSCVISAGHCKSYLNFAEFNTPASRRGRIQHSDPEDVYEVLPGSIQHSYTKIGNDWSIARLKKNKITGKYPGEVQGFYQVRFSAPKVGETIRITGYGQDKRDRDRNFAQQTHSGEVISVAPGGNTSLTYNIDTMGGNSGSSIIVEETQEIIGIHTNGGCYRNTGSNVGTLIDGHQKLMAAIKSCLQEDAQL